MREVLNLNDIIINLDKLKILEVLVPVSHSRVLGYIETSHTRMKVQQEHLSREMSQSGNEVALFKG